MRFPKKQLEAEIFWAYFVGMSRKNDWSLFFTSRNKEQRNNRNEEEIMLKKENIVVEIRKKSSFRSSVPTWNKRNFSIKSVKN